MSNFPFSDTNDLDLNLLFQLHHQIGNNTLSDAQYEVDICNIVNDKIEEIHFTLDENNSSFVKSKYFTQITQNQFISNSQSIDKNDLNFLHLNIRSANKNFEQLSILLDNIELDSFVIGLTETWLI